MSTNDIQPGDPSPALPERLRNDGWWLAQEPQDSPAAARLGSRLIVIETQHPQEEQQWIQPIL
ncbi:hypothetical protein OS035_20260 [Rhizobium sp. 268]|uniref:hypothetical protein n=1 Tax=Rhizobium TaxID=379 RepID=UPI000BE7B141|nr:MULTISPECIES: hypothetical protein [Rhizobium]MBB3525507.1 hypothetical protein [Rhizobium sp. BK456]MDR9784309.1 hypothetical protein [Rhizobium redzepovicii]PDS84801.1 hypothetical protein CO654_13655 [Rhizobium sp. L18]TBY46262.1 hypothetical protein E0H54_17260 [Rhizobium leguminosarum bv. viciae]